MYTNEYSRCVQAVLVCIYTHEFIVLICIYLDIHVHTYAYVDVYIYMYTYTCIASLAVPNPLLMCVHICIHKYMCICLLIDT